MRERCPSNFTILVVEDDHLLAFYLENIIKKEGYRTLVANTGRDALFKMASSAVNLVVLDWMLPDISGIELCRQLREKNNIIPVIFLTVRDNPEDKINALECGADDYIVKPLISAKELTIKINRLIERTYRGVPLPDITIGNAIINLNKKTVHKNGKSIQLTPIEARLIQFLYANKNKMISKDEIISAVWGTSYNVGSRSLEVYIRRVRKIIEDNPSKPVHLITERSSGYMLKIDTQPGG